MVFKYIPDVSSLTFCCSVIGAFCFPVTTKREEGFHIDLEDYLMGLLQLASELVCIVHLSHLKGFLCYL